MKHRPIDQQVIVITGVSNGIGLCTALLATERGATVVLLARSKATLEAMVDVAMGKWLPKLADRMAAMQAGRQEHAMPPRDPRGTLYAPGETGRIHGVGRDGEVLTGRGDEA